MRNNDCLVLGQSTHVVHTAHITNMEASQETFRCQRRCPCFFDKMISLFEKMKTVGKDKKWKPVQTAASILTTMSLKQIQGCLVTKKGFVFVLASRFGQDMLEDFFFFNNKNEQCCALSARVLSVHCAVQHFPNFCGQILNATTSAQVVWR